MFCTDQRRSDPNPDPRDYLIRNPQIIRIQKDMWGTAWYGWYGMVGMVWLVWYGWHGMVGLVWLAWYGWYGMVGMVWWVWYGWFGMGWIRNF